MGLLWQVLAWLRTTGHTQPTVVPLNTFFGNVSVQNICKCTDCFLPEILMVKESNNLIGQKQILVDHLKVCVTHNK